MKPTHTQVETNIAEIAHHIFSNSPKDPFTIDIGIDTGDDVIKSTAEQARYVFEVLMNFLIEGANIKYAKLTPESEVNLANLTSIQVQQLRKYFLSMGWDILVKTFPNEEGALKDLSNTTEYTPDQVEFYQLRVMDKERHIYHTIRFTFADRSLAK